MTTRAVSARQSEDGRWAAKFHLVPDSIGGELVISLVRQCACQRSLTLGELKSGLRDLADGELFSASEHGLAGTSWAEFLDSLNTSFAEYAIDDCIDKAHFLAQVAVESDSLRTTAEYRNHDGSYPSAWHGYSGGANYHGRGLIQLTHDHNYRKYSEHVGFDYVSDPDRLARSLAASVDSACWFWRSGSAWGDLSPRSKANDFIWITIGVNGGFNHHVERKRNLQNLVEALDVPSCVKHGNASFAEYHLKDSALSNTRNGPVYWRRQLGDRDAL